jgi:uncharacterized membrane protein
VEEASPIYLDVLIVLVVVEAVIYVVRKFLRR